MKLGGLGKITMAVAIGLSTQVCNAKEGCDTGNRFSPEVRTALDSTTLELIQSLGNKHTPEEILLKQMLEDEIKNRLPLKSLSNAFCYGQTNGVSPLEKINLEMFYIEGIKLKYTTSGLSEDNVVDIAKHSKFFTGDMAKEWNNEVIEANIQAFLAGYTETSDKK